MKEEITKKELDEYIKKLRNTPINEFDMEKFKEFTKEVIKDFDSRNLTKDKSGIPIREHQFLTILGHKYICKEFKNNVEAEFDTTQTIMNSHYNPSNNSIKYALSFITTTQSSFRKIFQTMHENRHAIQFSQFRKEPSQILDIDPLSIVMLKEQYIVSYKPELYKKNHKNFIMENDANVCAYEYLKEFVDKYMPELKEKMLQAPNEYNPWERRNYGKNIGYGYLEKLEFKKAEERILPVVYEADRTLKQNIIKEDIKVYPLLKLICNEDGTFKDYKQIVEDRQKAISANNNQEPTTRRDSLSDFKEEKRSNNNHIIEIYGTIIRTDPMLFLEYCLNEDRSMVKLQNFLADTPELMKAYKSEIHSIISKYININNYEKLGSTFKRLNNKDIVNLIDRRIKNIVTKDIKNYTGIQIDDTIDDDDEIIKDINTLDSEEKTIYAKLSQKLENGEINSTIVDKYTKVIKGIYKEYREESLKSNPNQDEKNNQGKMINKQDIIPIAKQAQVASEKTNAEEAMEQLGPIELDIQKEFGEEYSKDKVFVKFYKKYGVDEMTDEEKERFIERYDNKFKNPKDKKEKIEEIDETDYPGIL
ncbi:MAG: hypothetical protein IJ223_02760 [Clostridia bacterium]|nr:hypothetical protein [Clostridia bacterium]